MSTWFVRRGRQVKGPFDEAVVRRLAAAGKLRATDEASPDGSRWAAIEQLATRFPVEGGTAAVAGPASEAERIPAARPGRERRLAGDGAFSRRYAAMQRSDGRRRLAALAGLTVALGALTVGALSLVGAGADPGAQCDARAAPGVDWRSCRLDALDAERANLAGARLQNAKLSAARLLGARLTESDLSYADLSGASLGYADLRGARLLGTDLRRADLAYARLGGADLAYADLTGANLGSADLAGARLDHAIWIDGRTCAPGSVGSCRRAPAPG